MTAAGFELKQYRMHCAKTQQGSSARQPIFQRLSGHQNTDTMRTKLVNWKSLKQLVAPVLLGVSGAITGSTYGSGVGRSLPELMLALFLIVVASIFSVESLLARSGEHLLILIAGAVVGLVVEYFTQSTAALLVAGAVVGICTLPMLSKIRASVTHLQRTAPFIYYAILLIVGLAIFAPLGIWASSRGILKETFIAVAFLTSPFWVGNIIWRLR